jgi:hypothetical protein
MVSGTHLHPQHHREGRRAGSRREATHLLGTGRGRRRVGPTGEGGARREGGAAGRSSQPLLLHRAAAGPGKRGAWRPSRGPPSATSGRSAGRRGTTAEGEKGSRRRRKKEEVWARPETSWPGEEWPKEAKRGETGAVWWQQGAGREREEDLGGGG